MPRELSILLEVADADDFPAIDVKLANRLVGTSCGRCGGPLVPDGHPGRVGAWLEVQLYAGSEHVELNKVEGHLCDGCLTGLLIWLGLVQIVEGGIGG
jgi:hypothetical protein